MLTDIEKQNQDMMSLNSRKKRNKPFNLRPFKRKELLTKFDNCLWMMVVDIVTVRNDGSLVFKFNDGTKVET